ncbi:porin [Brenneria populi subsp. brevivirga]|uniref:porin n=1 Tax=Brenneria populi TaxID=1505588 RepID=UPI002E18C6BF|nr:porin [Brenneria populi subsp. brevivirga]
MMKRNILAVVIPALLAAGAVNAAEIYNKDGNKLDLNGRVDARHLFSDDSGNNGDATRARIGFKGETQITSDLTGYGRYESEIRSSSNESNGTVRTRFAFAGLKFADFGSLDYGRNQAIGYEGISYTDVLPIFGGDQSYTDTQTGRKNGLLTYRNKDFFGLVDGLNFGLQAIGKDKSDTEAGRNTRTDSDLKANGDGWGTSLSYESDIGLGVIASYSAVQRTAAQNTAADGTGKKAETWAAGVKYDANNLYLAAIYGEYTNVPFDGGISLDKTEIFEAVAQYTFDFGLTPSLAYVQAKGKQNTSAAGNDDDVTKYVSVAATYAFNKNFSTYVDYKINLLDSDNPYVQAYKRGDNGVSDDDVVGVGVKYQF